MPRRQELKSEDSDKLVEVFLHRAARDRVRYALEAGIPGSSRTLARRLASLQAVFSYVREPPPMSNEAFHTLETEFANWDLNRDAGLLSTGYVLDAWQWLTGWAERNPAEWTIHAAKAAPVLQGAMKSLSHARSDYVEGGRERVQPGELSASRLDAIVASLPALAGVRMRAFAELDPSSAGRLTHLLISQPTLLPSQFLVDHPKWMESSSPMVWAVLGELAEARLDRASAWQCFERAAEEFCPPRWRWFARAALAAIGDRDWSEAVRLGARAYESGPNDPFVRLVQVMLFGDDHQRIRAHGWGAVEADGFPVRVWMVPVYRDLRMLDEAISVAREEHDRNPDRLDIGLEVAELLLTRAVQGGGAQRLHDIAEGRRRAGITRDTARRFGFPSARAVYLMIHAALSVDDDSEAYRLARTPEAGGEATQEEASNPSVAHELGLRAVENGDLDVAQEAVQTLPQGSFERLHLEARLKGSSGGEVQDKRLLLERALRSAESLHDKLKAWHDLADIGVWPLPGWEWLYRESPENAQRYEALSLIRRGEALTAIRILVRDRHRSLPDAILLVKAYMAAGRIDEAVDVYTDAASRWREPDLLADAAIDLARNGREEEGLRMAEAALRKLLPGSPMVARMRNQLMWLLEEKGDHTGVIAQAEARLADDPSDTDTRWTLVNNFIQLGKYDEAWREISLAALKPSAWGHAQLWLILARGRIPDHQWLVEEARLNQQFPTGEGASDANNSVSEPLPLPAQ